MTVRIDYATALALARKAGKTRVEMDSPPGEYTSDPARWVEVEKIDFHPRSEPMSLRVDGYRVDGVAIQECEIDAQRVIVCTHYMVGKGTYDRTVYTLETR